MAAPTNEPRPLWRAILAIGPRGYHAVEQFAAGWFLLLFKPVDADRFMAIWKAIMLFAFDADWPSHRRWYRGRDMLTKLLGLNAPIDVARAVADMTVSVQAYAGIAAEDFLVERMVTGAVAELLVGVRRVEGFAMALTIAGGGTMVELLRDATTLLLPASRSDIAEALAGLKVAQLLAGWRGKPAGDIEAAIDAITAIAAFAMAQGETLVELDVNPLIVTPHGATAADVLLRRVLP